MTVRSQILVFIKIMWYSLMSWFFHLFILNSLELFSFYLYMHIRHFLMLFQWRVFGINKIFLYFIFEVIKHLILLPVSSPIVTFQISLHLNLIVPHFIFVSLSVIALFIIFCRFFHWSWEASPALLIFPLLTSFVIEFLVWSLVSF